MNATLVNSLIVVAALAFGLAVLSNCVGELPWLPVTAEGFSRASANLALLAIAVALRGRAGRPS
jgi:hypothetical protein